MAWNQEKAQRKRDFGSNVFYLFENDVGNSGEIAVNVSQKTVQGIEEPELSDVAKFLKIRPNPFMTPTAFWNAVEMNRNHFGNAYVCSN